MKRNKLTVPQEGTQPASYKIQTPLDNMISGDSITTRNTSASDKRAASFNLDRELLSQFKAKCATNGASMSKVIEEFMKDYIQK